MTEEEMKEILDINHRELHEDNPDLIIEKEYYDRLVYLSGEMKPGHTYIGPGSISGTGIYKDEIASILIEKHLDKLRSLLRGEISNINGHGDYIKKSVGVCVKTSEYERLIKKSEEVKKEEVMYHALGAGYLSISTDNDYIQHQGWRYEKLHRLVHEKNER